MEYREQWEKGRIKGRDKEIKIINVWQKCNELSRIKRNGQVIIVIEWTQRIKRRTINRIKPGQENKKSEEKVEEEV